MQQINNNIIYFDISIAFWEWEQQPQLLILMNDITQEVKLKRLEIMAEYKDNLLATVTHDLKTPLNSIM